MAEALAWAAFFAFAALVLALRFWVLPDIERYRDDIVARVSKEIGLPVKIGGIEAGWLGFRPQVSFTDVRLYDAGGREVLALPSVENVIGWRTLFARELRLHSLVIDGPRFAVRRDAAGALHVAGLALAPGAGVAAPASGPSAEARAAAWILQQGDIQIRNAEIEWRDEKRGAPALALSEVNLRLRIGFGELALGLTARPPAALAESVELRAAVPLEGLEKPQSWSGRLYAALGASDVVAWRPWVDLPLDLRQGQGAVRVWATVESGELREVTSDVALNDVSASLGAGLEPLELATVRGRLYGRSGKDGYELTARELALTPVVGPALQPMDFRVNWKPPAGGAAESGQVTARLVELEPLARLLSGLPVPAALRSRVAELNPRGSLADFKLDWQGPLAAPQRLTLRARLVDLALRAWRGIPAFSGLSGTLEASDTKGRLQLRARNFGVQLPGVFPEPELAFESLGGQVDWERRGERGAAVQLSALAFANRDGAGSASGSYETDGAGPGRIDLTATLSRADAGRIGRYLPHPAMIGGAGVRGWLAAAIVAGQGTDVQLRLRGDLQRFPFRDPTSGQFLVTGRFRGGVLDYVPGWPRIENIEGELRFERERMEVTARSATIYGVRLAGVRALIPALGTRETRLAVTGEADGPTADFLKYIESSPVRRMIGGATSTLGAAGQGKLHLALDIPLGAPAGTRVSGDYEFTANAISVHPQLPSIERAVGRLSFTDGGLALHDIRGRFLGGPVTIAGGTRPGAGVEIVARGEATVAGLGALLEEPWRRSLSGAAPYVATVTAREGLVRIGVESSLRGLASALPAPLDKAAAEALPLRLEIFPADGGQRDRVSIALGRRVQAELLRRHADDAAGPMVVQRGAVWLSPEAGQGIRLPERPGLLVYGALPALDLDAWLAAVAAGGSRADTGLAFDLRLGQLDVYGRRARNVALTGAADAGGWTAAVTSDEVAGDLSFRGEAGGRLVARLARFTLPPDSPSAAPRAKGPDRNFPAIDVIAERFQYRGKDFGHVEVVASPAGADWKVEKLDMANPDSRLQAQGLWRRGAAPQTSLEFTLAASDTGKFLERVGYPSTVKGGNSKLKGTVSWRGDPPAIDFASLTGRLELDAQNGQFLEVDPGLGKLISLMNLQALPRRATLDFRDVFSKGFAFDRITAASQVDRGVMNVEEFRMRGPAAEVEMTGEVDLARETQNLKLRVVPNLGASTAGGLALVNPIAGAVALGVTWLLKNPLGKIFAYEYTVTGGWSEPKVERQNAPAAPATERASP